VLVVAICSMKNICGMEIVNLQDKKDRAMDQYHFWSDDYSKNVNQIKKLDLQIMRSDLEDKNFLPDSATTLDHLLYLSTICKTNRVQTLFTAKQQNKFDACFKIK